MIFQYFYRPYHIADAADFQHVTAFDVLGADFLLVVVENGLFVIGKRAVFPLQFFGGSIGFQPGDFFFLDAVVIRNGHGKFAVLIHLYHKQIAHLYDVRLYLYLVFVIDHRFRRQVHSFLLCCVDVIDQQFFLIQHFCHQHGCGFCCLIQRIGEKHHFHDAKADAQHHKGGNGDQPNGLFVPERLVLLIVLVFGRHRWLSSVIDRLFSGFSCDECHRLLRRLYGQRIFKFF